MRKEPNLLSSLPLLSNSSSSFQPLLLQTKLILDITFFCQILYHHTRSEGRAERQPLQSRAIDLIIASTLLNIITTSVATMASIPLLCSVCPKEPEFSDISHLLTHVASKGHLHQYHKAQIRGRQDATIRGTLATYDRWYERHKIEKLLSERMIAKETKDTSSRKLSSNARPAPAASVKGTKPRKRRATITARQRVGTLNL